MRYNPLLTSESRDGLLFPRMSLIRLVKIIPLLFVFLLMTTIIEQALNDQLSEALASNDSSLFLIAAGIMFTSLFSTILQVGTFLTFAKSRLSSPGKFNWYQIPMLWNDFAKEFIRGIGVASMWCFAFLLPGFKRFIDYLFIPFVVFLDPLYEQGQVDALKRSSELGSKIRFKLGMIWLFFSITAPLLSTAFFSEYESFSQTPLQATTVVFIEAIIQFLFSYTLLKNWIRFMQKGADHGTDVQLAGN